MERKKLTETFMMISESKKPFGPHDLSKNIMVNSTDFVFYWHM